MGGALAQLALEPSPECWGEGRMPKEEEEEEEEWYNRGQGRNGAVRTC